MLITELLRLEKSSKISNPNLWPNTPMPTKPHWEVPHLLILFGHFQGQWLHHLPGECSIQQRWRTVTYWTARIKGKKRIFLKFYFKLHFTSSHTIKNPLNWSTFPFQNGSICFQQQTPSGGTRSATSQPTLHPLPFQPKPPGWSLLPTSPQTTFSRKNTHKHGGERSFPALPVGGKEGPAQPSFSVRGERESAGLWQVLLFNFFFSKKTLSPAAAHYLWQLFLDLKWVLKPCCQLPSCHPAILWLNLLFLL